MDYRHVYLYMHVHDCAYMMDGIINPVDTHVIYILNEQQNHSRATHVAIIQNMMRDVSTRRSLSTASTR